MKLLLILFVLLSCGLEAQILTVPKVHFTNQKTGEERAFLLGRNALVSLKKVPAKKDKFPSSLDAEGKLYTLKLTQQNGTDLIFNDSIYLSIDAIDYLVLKQNRNAARYTFGVLSVAGLGVVVAMDSRVAFFTMAFYPLSILYFNAITKDKLYTHTWKLEIQHSPELLFPEKNTLNYGWWPDLFERYSNK
ncbi:MAG: hypothetical protein K9I36_07710 [Bacteroidia bacterium]|nr:hypothetical protein [Bacteroidia bacterium]